jgi:predicted transcriptional regulator
MDETWLHCFLIYRIKKNSRINIIDKSKIHEIISRALVKQQGIPSFFIRLVFDDLVNLGLIEKITPIKYKINSPALERKIKSLCFSY